VSSSLYQIDQHYHMFSRELSFTHLKSKYRTYCSVYNLLYIYQCTWICFCKNACLLFKCYFSYKWLYEDIILWLYMKHFHKYCDNIVLCNRIKLSLTTGVVSTVFCLYSQTAFHVFCLQSRIWRRGSLWSWIAHLKILYVLWLILLLCVYSSSSIKFILARRRKFHMPEISASMPVHSRSLIGDVFFMPIFLCPVLRSMEERQYLKKHQVPWRLQTGGWHKTALVSATLQS
jgi:hypothetical protein